MITIDGGTGVILHNGTNIQSGNVVQTLQTTRSDTDSTNSQTEADLITLNITPSSSSSKIMLFVDLKFGSSSQSTDPQLMLYRDSTKVYHGDAADNRLTGFFGGDEYDSYNNAQWLQKCVQANYLDSPSTSSQITYKVKWRIVDTGHTLYLNRTGQDNNSAAYHRSVSSLTAMEIAA